MRANDGRGRGEEGFTLLEVITAIFIFFCGIVGILSLFTTALFLHKTALDRTVSALAAEQVVREVGALLEQGALQSRDTGTLLPLASRPLPGASGYFFEAEFDEAAAGADAGAVLATIRITWKSRGRERGETFAAMYRAGAGFRSEVQRVCEEVERRSIPDE